MKHTQASKNRWSQRVFLIMLLGAGLLLAWYWPRYPYTEATQTNFSIQRLGNEAIITHRSHPSLDVAKTEHGYVNISGPSLIRVPDWVKNPLGQYYLYFAHHKGQYIRMAYSDELIGPWTIYQPGVLHLEDSGFPTERDETWENMVLADLGEAFSIHIVRDYMIMARRAMGPDTENRKSRNLPATHSGVPHIASPDIVVDHGSQSIKMYYHGQGRNGYQYTRSALSTNGLSFEATQEKILSPFVRAFVYQDQEYLLAMPGVLFRKNQKTNAFEPRARSLFDPNMRHSAVYVDDDVLHVFWSRVGDSPESILHSTVVMGQTSWRHWRASKGVTMLSAALTWEGSNLPVLRSFRGEIYAPANDIRDPAIFIDQNDRRYLLYSAGGEQAIGIAELQFKQ